MMISIEKNDSNISIQMGIRDLNLTVGEHPTETVWCLKGKTDVAGGNLNLFRELLKVFTVL